MDAPSLWPFPDRLTAAWIGADETGIHQDIRSSTAEGLSERVVLPLPPRNPYAQQMFPAGEDNIHLLWLDADSEGQVRLSSAMITPELEVERGPVVVTEQITWRYTAIPNGDGSLWVVTSGGSPIEPSLYAHYIDSEGRPRLKDIYQIATDADWPALARRNDGTVYLFWIRRSDGAVMQSTLANGSVENIQTITETVLLNPGDRLVSFSAGLDQTYAYLVWNVNRANGEAETWFTSNTFDAQTWDAPLRFGFGTTKGSFETGFNSGTAGAARDGGRWLSWATLLTGQFDALPIAAVNDSTLKLLYLQGGGVVGYQDVVPISKLIGMPALLTDRDRFLYLAWSEPGDSGKADLKVTTTRRF